MIFTLAVMTKIELSQALIQTADYLGGMPQIDEFSAKDQSGNVIFDSSKHIIPGGMIGMGVAMYYDTVKRKIPYISAKIGGLMAFGAGLAYEGYDICGKKVPGSEGLIDNCQKGYLDGATAKIASIDTLSDLIFTFGGGITAAFIVTNVAFAVRKKLKMKKYYKMSHEEHMDYLAEWDYIKPEDREMIEVAPPRPNVDIQVLN